MKTLINDADAWYLMVKGDYLYYSSTRGKFLKRAKLDGSDVKTLVNEEVYEFLVDDDRIIYVAAKSTYRMKSDGTEKVALLNKFVWCMNAADGWLYYADWNNGNKLTRTKLDGSSSQIVLGEIATRINIIGDWIYFDNGVRQATEAPVIYKVKKDGTGKVLVD